MNTQPVSYLQTDPRWAGIPYAVKGESATIGGSGCGPTSMAMVLATWADKSVTPKTECAWALENGYKAKGQGTYYSYFTPAAKRYGLDCRQLNHASIYGNNGAVYHTTAREAVLNGDLVIACMGKGNWTRSGHFVLVWWIDQEKDVVYINDPASTKTARTRGSYRLFVKQVKYYFVIKRPATAPEKEEDMTEKEIRSIVTEELAAQRDALIADVLAAMPTDKIFDTIDEVPEWAQAAVQRRIDLGILEGTGSGLGLSYDLLRQFVVADREEARKVRTSADGQ